MPVELESNDTKDQVSAFTDLDDQDTIENKNITDNLDGQSKTSPTLQLETSESVESSEIKNTPEQNLEINLLKTISEATSCADTSQLSKTNTTESTTEISKDISTDPMLTKIPQ